MIRLAFRFTSGRYHATPWGRHVNEGAIEWPPSPWRISRALLAQGYTRLGWSEIPEVARRLFESLSTTAPVYRFTKASTGHTRHYVPLKDKSAKIIDAFAWLGRDEESLFVEYDVQMSAEESALLGQLVEGLPYLGRAESTVAGRLMDEGEALESRALLTCRASESSVVRHERVPLLAPVDPAVYEAWRAGEVERDTERMITGSGGAKLNRKQLQTLAELYPPSLTDALGVSTKTLQELGWSQPPGSKWLSYWIPEDALRTTPVDAAVRASERKDIKVAVLSLSSDSKGGNLLPPMEDSLRRMEALHDALVRKSDRGDGPSPVFTAKLPNGEKLRGHRHAMLIPVSQGKRDRIHRVIVASKMGFDAAAWHALHSVEATYAKDLPKLFVSLVGTGAPGDFAGIAQLGTSMVWESATAFVAPRHLKAKGKNSLFGQVLAELQERLLPEPVAVEVEDAEGVYRAVTERTALTSIRFAPRWRRFRRERRDTSKGGPPANVGFGMRIRFPKPITGPLAIGYGCHYGLGSFVAVDERGL